MKKIWQIALLLCCALVAVSCNDDDDEVVDEAWKSKNNSAFLAISANKEYTELKSLGNNGSIFYKVLKKGEGTAPIYYNSQVRMYYTGTMMGDDDLFSSVFDAHEPPYQSPADFYANSLIEGWTTALQYMKEGDRWEIWVPYQLGYGTGGNSDGSIPGYSTLKFELEVVEILEP